MDKQSLLSLLFFLVLYLLVGLLLVWLMRRRAAAKHDDTKQESDDIYVEPGTFGESTYVQAVALIAQVDALIERMDEAEMDQMIDDAQKGTW